MYLFVCFFKGEELEGERGGGGGGLQGRGIDEIG